MCRWKAQCGLDQSAQGRNHLSTHLPHDRTPSESPNSCDSSYTNEAIAWRSSSLPVMDLPPFVSNPSFHSSMRWELFNQAQLYKEYYLLLYLLVCPQLLQTLQVTSCALGMELTLDSGRQSSNCQVTKVSHRPREWGWVPLLTEGGGWEEGTARGRTQRFSWHKGPPKSSHLSPWLTEEEADAQRGRVTFLSSYRQESLLSFHSMYSLDICLLSSTRQ